MFGCTEEGVSGEKREGMARVGCWKVDQYWTNSGKGMNDMDIEHSEGQT